MEYYNKKSVIVRASRISDVIRMGDHLRKSDVEEVWASHHHTPQTALIDSYNMSTFCLTVLIKGEPVAMFGLAPQSLLDDHAAVWLLATDKLETIGREFLRESKRFINMMLEQYPLLENYVDARNLVSIEWLKWCGAKIEPAVPYGVDGHPFHHFTFRRADQCAIQ